MLLIGVIAAGVLAGTLIMQAPNPIAANPDSFVAWLANPRAKYGEPWASVFGALNLYRIFSSLWFRALLAVLTLSVVVCTVNRMPGIVASVTRPSIKVPERLFDRAPLRAELRYTADQLPCERIYETALRVLRGSRFRVIPWDVGQVPGNGAGLGIFADRNRYGKYGTFANHIGIVAILGSAVLGGAFGWRDEGLMVPEGSARPVGHGTTLSVRSESFDDEYYPSGVAKDFRSDIVVLDGDREVARKTIRVNDPLDYHGIRFHQAFFGPSAIVRVRDADGNVVHDDGVALGYELKGGDPAGPRLTRNGGFFTLGNRNGLPTLAVWVVVPANVREADPEIPAGSVRLELFEPRQARPSVIETLPQGEPHQILGHTFEFVRERQFSGLQVSYNPAINIIWLSCALMVLGSVTVFNFPLRRLWVRVDAETDGTRVRLAAVTNKDVLFAREFERLTLALDRALEKEAGAT